MAESPITLTSASILKSADGQMDRGTLGATLGAGTLVYKDAATNDVLKAADSSSEAKAAVVGMLLNSGAIGQPADYCIFDDELVVSTDAKLEVGAVYGLSATAGKLVRIEEIEDGFITILGIAVDNDTLQFEPNPTTVQRNSYPS